MNDYAVSAFIDRLGDSGRAHDRASAGVGLLAPAGILHARNTAVSQARQVAGRTNATSYDFHKTAELLAAAERADAALAKKKFDERREQARKRLKANTPVAELTYRGWSLRMRPKSRAATSASESYLTLWSRYLCEETGREGLGLLVSDDSRGGFLAPPQFATMVLTAMDETQQMRGLATVLPPLESAVSLKVPRMDNWDDAEWSNEVLASDLAEDDSASFSQRELKPRPLVKFVTVTKKWLRSTTVDPVVWLAERFAYRLGRPAEAAYVAGTGVEQPLGVFTTSDEGIGTDRDYTCSATTSFTFDNIISALYTLAEPYHANASWLASRGFYSRAALLKDAAGSYVWQPATSLDEPDLLLRRPCVVSEHAPSTFTAGQPVAVIGDFRAGYHIQDTLAAEVQVLEELYALKNQTAFIGRMETDGAPTDSSAFVRLKLAAA